MAKPGRKRHGGILRRHLDGFVFTQNGWVQSYGSALCETAGSDWRYQPSGTGTVEWAKYAQSLTDKPVKRDVDRPGDYSLLVYSPRGADP